MKQFFGLVLVVALAGCASTDTAAKSTWTAARQTDPVTGVSRCVVTAPDRLFGSNYTKSTHLYPFVETNSEAGLLVGASVGGTVRYAAGDIVWRVDQNSPRTITMAETPAIGAQTAPLATEGMTAEQKEVIEASMKMTAGITSSIQNGITAVGGEKAREMLAEMKAGQGLLFRAAAAAPAAGIPNDKAFQVGQVTGDGLRPIPLDETFHAALAECGL